MNGNLRILRTLIGRVYPGEILYLTRSSAFVKFLWVTLLANLQRRGDVHLDEFHIGAEDYLARAQAIQAIGRNKRCNHNQAGICHQFRNFRHAPDVFDPVLRRKSKVGIQTMTHIVSIQYINLHVTMKQVCLQSSCQRRLTGTRQTSQPDNHAMVPVSLRASAIVDLAFGPKDIGALDWAPLDVSAAKNDASSRYVSLVNNHKATARRDPLVI